MGSKKNPPVPSDFSFEHDGEQLEYSKYTSRQVGHVDGFLVERGRFGRCPICFEPDPDVAEHVPPQSLGGKVMTWTCAPCNNDFGPAEDQLRSFIDLETTVHAEAANGSVPGRRAAKVAFRSAQGRPSGVFARSWATGFDEALASGEGQLTIKPLDMEQVTAAVLKHAYLAACLHQREVPQTDVVELVRAVLLAARSRDKVALNGALMALQSADAVPGYGWLEATATGGPPIFLFRAEEDEAGGAGKWVFMLGGRFSVEWPFPDVDPRAANAPAPGEQPSAADSDSDV